jgi:hypothetical protein
MDGDRNDRAGLLHLLGQSKLGEPASRYQGIQRVVVVQQLAGVSAVAWPEQAWEKVY